MPPNLSPEWEDATRVEGDYLGRRDGLLIILHKMRVRFWAKAPKEAWSELLQPLGVGSLSPNLPLCSFVALPPETDNLQPYLITGVSPDFTEADRIEWEFTWARAPKAQPPKAYQEESSRVGGFPVVLERLAAGWPSKVPVKAHVRATYILHAREWLFPPFHASQKSRRSGETRVVPTVWKVEPMAGPLKRIGLSEAEEQVYFLTGSGSLSIQFNSRLLNRVDGAIWQNLRLFLKKRESVRRRALKARKVG